MDTKEGLDGFALVSFVPFVVTQYRYNQRKIALNAGFRHQVAKEGVLR
jgi:hypothetical protein